MTSDPRERLSSSPMSNAQIVAIAITIGLNALDGFDVLSISFASPGIARDWGIDRAALGVVLSMELIGMAVGSMVIGMVADALGRRRTMLACLGVMALGMALVTTTHSIRELCIWRVFTGLGIGGMLAATNAVATEFASERRRDLCVALMASGYPVGAVIGGTVASLLLRGSDWRVVFQFGALATAACLPLVYFLVPESIAWLCQRQPPGALAAVNAGLARMGHAPVEALPVRSTVRPRAGLADLFTPALASTTLLVTSAYFLHITSFYYLLKWVPKIVVDMGYAASSAAGVLVWANVGGAIGGGVFGFAAHRFSARHLTMFVLVASTIMLALFGRGQTNLYGLSFICAVTGFFTNGGVVGLYAILARAFPTHARASGTGFAIGVGRGGAVIAPMIAGSLFTHGFGLQAVSIAMGLGSLLGATVLAFVRLPAATAAPVGVTAAAPGGA